MLPLRMPYCPDRGHPVLSGYPDRVRCWMMWGTAGSVGSRHRPLCRDVVTSCVTRGRPRCPGMVRRSGARLSWQDILIGCGGAERKLVDARLEDFEVSECGCDGGLRPFSGMCVG